MGLFDFLSKPKKTTPTPLKKVTFKHSEGFRGFKRIPLVNYKDKESEIGIAALKDLGFDFKGKDITIKEFYYNGNNQAISVYVDGYKIGSLFPNTSEDEDRIRLILNSGVSAVHVRIDYSGEMNDRHYAYLFIKIGD